jgi:hypothetical protein
VANYPKHENLYQSETELLFFIFSSFSGNISFVLKIKSLFNFSALSLPYAMISTNKRLLYVTYVFHFSKVMGGYDFPGSNSVSTVD